MVPSDARDPVTVTIPMHFHGPSASGNGGYTCGVAAATVDAAPVQVRLKRPPPLDVPLRVEHRGQGGVLLDGDDVVAEATPAELAVDLPEPVTPAAAREAIGRFDVAAYRAGHAFPTCFTCGPDRLPGEGLRIFPAPVDERPGMVASPWTPDERYADEHGLVRDEIVWAALDCLSGLAWIVGDPPTGPAVLGQLTLSIDRRPAPGEELVVAGWRIGADGRKCHGGSVAWTSAGEPIARGRAIWILLADEHQATFDVANR